MYPDPTIAAFVDEHFVPVRVHARDQADEFKRLGAQFGARWTPTVLVLDADGQVRHRIEGFLPLADFLPQLRLGVAHAAFGRGDYGAAEGLFDEIVRAHPDGDAAAEAQYWAGVSRYKGTGDGAALTDTARRFRERYQGTSWAKKASVWS